jgi:hypothetical protein
VRTKASSSSLHDPLDWVCALYEERREEIERRGWNLTDVYLELGGGGPGSSAEHEGYGDFFNGQARALLADEDRARLEYWAGIPERGVALRERAIEALGHGEGAALDGGGTPADDDGGGGGRADPQTRALILAHNQIDAELYAHFSGAAVREGSRSAPRGPDAEPGRGAVCVLGMSRSGTSLTARILDVLGVDLGPEGELMAAAAENNPAGFWEHEGIADLNEDILATLGDAPRQRWRWPPALAPGWEDDPRLEGHLRAARSILQQSFAGQPLWGWKDPRTCLTLPFWLKALAQAPQVESSMRYVICVRHPLDVAASLEARDGVSLDEAMQLWLRYTSQAVIHSHACPRVFVDYDRYFPDWEDQVVRLARFLAVPTPSPSQRRAIEAHLDPDLRHHSNGGADADRPGLLPEAVELHAQLAALAAPQAALDEDAEALLDAAARRVAQRLAQA